MMPIPTVGEGRHKKKRLSFGWTLKKGEEQHPIPALEENDDEAERRQRRKTHTRNSFVGDQDSSLNASILSPESNSSASGRRASMKLSEQPLSLKGKTALSSAQLIDLYSRCIQLSTENVSTFILYCSVGERVQVIDPIATENQQREFLEVKSDRLYG